MGTGRRLVLTADDFGYDPDSAALVAGLLRHGRVSATTALAVAPDLAEAAPSLREATGGACGLHVALSSERGRERWAPLAGAGRTARPAAAGPVVEASTAAQNLADPDGLLPVDPADSEARAMDALVAEEITAQHQRLLSLGLTPVRMDFHSGCVYGLHGHSTLGAALRLCAQWGLGCRLPRSLDLFLGPDAPVAFRELHARAVAGADALEVPLPATMATNQQPTSQIDGYDALRASYLDLLPRLPEGTSEIFLHPGADTPWARERFGRDWDKRVWEARLVEDPVWLEALAAEGIELVATW